MTCTNAIRLSALSKLAAFGDIVNAGLSSMCMGSPYAPRMFQPGTNRLKTTEQLQKDQKSTALGGIAGLGLAYYPWSVGRALRVGGAFDFSGKIYSYTNPMRGTMQYYFSKADDYLRNARLAAEQNKGYVSDTIRDDALKSISNNGIANLANGINQLAKNIDSGTASNIDHVQNYIMRKTISGLENVPLLGNTITFSSDYDKLRRQGRSGPAAAAKATVNALPFYRHIIRHP